jgi:hypothetical protein
LIFEKKRDVIPHVRDRLLRPLLLSLLVPLVPSTPTGASIPIRFADGPSHGFLVLKNEEGKVLASGELLQLTKGHHLWSKMTFRFRDGSLDDETTTFTQDSEFHLLSDHHVQKGPSFPHPIDVAIDVRNGTITRKSEGPENGKVEVDRIDMPADLSNGLLLDMIKNLPAESSETKISMIVAASKPRVIKLLIQPEQEERFYVAGVAHRAKKYVIKIELGGIAGAVAPVIGQKPHASQVWIAAVAPPTMLKAESQFYLNGPVWTVELCSPTWGKT